MEVPPVREGAFSPEAAYYIDKLARKEEECNEIVAQFNKYKVKTKVRFDQLRHEISNILHEKNVDPEDEQHHPAMLLISLNETQSRLEEAEKLSVALRSDVERQQVHINDQIILIKNLEDQLRDWEESEIARERRRDEPVDLERVQQQMMYKDERIVELNSVILDKERQILDLQESCRSASEVATSKKEAMRIVQKKFDEMERRSRREASTETDDRVTGVSFDGPTHAATTPERTQRSMQQPSQPPRPVRTSSPGRAVHVVNKNGLHSPPPLDPAEIDDLPGTSQLAKTNVDGNSSLREKKQRKRVTFAVPQAASREDISRLTADADTDEITDALVNLTAENERLRGEVERLGRMEEEMEEMAVRVAQAESAVSEAEREARHTSLKARAVAQARIKELEDRMASQNALGAQQIERLRVETETLRSTRDWEVEQNARMREQLAHTKEKLRQLKEELDASVLANRAGDKKLDEKEALLTSLVNELEDAESLAVFLEDQKHQILDDVDQLKDIIKLHEEQINLLEADNLIYETRVGHLRDELGVSKINQRDHIKSKAFNTKLQMINKEKEQIDRKANDERLRTKALHAKVQILEAENERLMARLCEAEMAGEDTSSLDAACKQLQTRMEQAEAESARVRTEFDARIHAAEFAADSLREECDRLRAERDAAEQNNVLLQQQYRQLQHDQQQMHMQHVQQLQHQPGPSKTQQLQQEDSSSSLEAALRLAQSAQETLTRERDELAERVHVLGGENFELTRRTEEAEREVQRIESEFSRLESRLRESSERAAAATAAASAADAERVRREERTVEREQELIDLRARVAERETTVERIDGELKRLRAELDHAHLSMAETSAVKKEVQHLQHQLEIEREVAAAKWQQVMVQLKSYEELASNSGWDSRKTSIDETATAAAAAELRAARAEADAAAAREQLRMLQQAQQTQPHQLQHVQPVQQEVPRRAVSTEDEEETEDGHEMDRLRARVEELESEVELSHELNVESGRTVQMLQQRLVKAENEKRLLESLTVEFSEDIADMKEAATAAPVAAPETVQQASGEETDELRSKIEEMEEEASLSAELHVEMGRTVQALEGKIREMEMERRLHEMMSVELTTELHELRQLQQQSQSTTAAEEPAADAAAAAEQEAQLLQQLEEEKRQRAREHQAATDELYRLQSALRAAEDGYREVSRQLAEKEQTESLVRATAATFEAVAAAAAGSTEEAVQQQAAPAADAACPSDQEEERATLVQENVLLREAVYQNVRHSESVTSDVARLLELKEELEKAVEALRGEIWSLNGQLKASVLDRENLQDRVVELDTKLALEKRKADLLDVELAEQVELRENAQRQAAEAENESNRRLAECAEMDGKREDLEKAYALLAGYYSQLQEAYNVLYTQQQQQQAHLQQERLQQTESGEGSSREDRSTQTDVAAAVAAEPSTSTASVAGAAPVGVSSSSSSRRAMAEQYASRLASLRELSVQLTKSVLATELATLESELDNSITSIEGLSNDCPEAGASVDALLDAIIQDYDGSSSVSPDARAKIASVHAMLRAKISEVERVHSALREQRGVCTALEQRLTELEAAGPPPGIGSLGSPGATSSTAPSELEERIEECEALRAHVEQLQEIISRYVAREEAARLATREADVDSLFRSNAELAHENVRLQNELDEEKGEERREEEEKEKRETTSSSTQTHDEKDFDEAELELVKEELAAEREARKEAEKRIEATEKELADQQQELEGTIMDLLEQQKHAASAAPAAAATAEEKEALEAAAAAAAAEVAEVKAELAKERAARVGAEKKLKRNEEELEEMKTEMQLMEADGDEVKQELMKVEAEKNAAEKKAKEMELEKGRLQEEVMQLQEEKKEGRKEKEGEDGWGSDGWGEDEKEEDPTASPQELEQIRAQLQQEQHAREAVEQQLQSVEEERLQLQQEMTRLRESQKREEEQPVQQSMEEEEEGDGWGEDWGEEKKEEEPSLDAQLAALREQLEEERKGRKETEERMKKIEEEKEKKDEELKKSKEEEEEMREKLMEAEEREEEMKKELREMKEKKEKEMETKEEEEEADGWGNDGWGEENQESSSVDASAELSQLKLQLQQETAAKVAAQQKRDELQRLQESWDAQRERELAQMRQQLQQEEEEKKNLLELANEGELYQEQLREEIEAWEKENAILKEEAARAGGSGTDQELRAEIMKKEQEIASLTTTYHLHVEELEGQGNRVRETMIMYEKILHDKTAKMKWLEEKMAAMETGGEMPPPLMEEEEHGGAYDDGYRGPVQEEQEVQKALESEPEEVDYHRYKYEPEDPDDVSVMFNAMKDFIDEAADLQDESRNGGPAAHHHERLRLRHIVKGMAEKLQELDDEAFNEGLKDKKISEEKIIKEMKRRLRAKTVELDTVKMKLASLEEKKRAGDDGEEGGEGGEGRGGRVEEITEQMLDRLKMDEENETWSAHDEDEDDDEVEEMGRERDERREKMRSELERLVEQNDLLQNSEAKLTECVDTANRRAEEAKILLQRMERKLARATAEATAESAAQIEELQRQVTALEATVNAKDSQLAIALRDVEAAVEAKNAVEQQLKRVMENAAKSQETKSRRPTGAANAPAAARSYAGGSRRTSNASSRNEEIREEPPQPVRVDQGLLQQQEMDFSSSASSIGDANAFRRRGKGGQ